MKIRSILLSVKLQKLKTSSLFQNLVRHYIFFFISTSVESDFSRLITQSLAEEIDTDITVNVLRQISNYSLGKASHQIYTFYRH